MNQNSNQSTNIEYWFQDQKLVDLVSLLCQNEFRQFQQIEGQKCSHFKKKFQLLLMLNSPEEFQSQLSIYKNEKFKFERIYFEIYIAILQFYKTISPNTLVESSNEILEIMNKSQCYILNPIIKEQQENHLENFKQFIYEFQKDKYQFLKKKRRASLKKIQSQQIKLLKSLKIHKKRTYFFFSNENQNQNNHQNQNINKIESQLPFNLNLLRNIMNKQFFGLLTEIVLFQNVDNSEHLLKWAIEKEWKKEPEKLLLKLYGIGIDHNDIIERTQDENNEDENNVQVSQKPFSKKFLKIFKELKEVSVPKDLYKKYDQNYQQCLKKNISNLIENIQYIFR